MKSTWIVQTTENDYINVLEELKLQKVEIATQLDFIFIILVIATEKKANTLKTINGVIGVEKERNVSI